MPEMPHDLDVHAHHGRHVATDKQMLHKRSWAASWPRFLLAIVLRLAGKAMFRIPTLSMALLCLCGSFVAAQQNAPPGASPHAMADAIIGPEKEADAQALAKIHVSAVDEQRIGKLATDAYLANLKRQGARVVTQGQDIEYLRQLVAKLQPMMTQQDRYPKIQVYLVLSDLCSARCFPGGHIVFFRGLLDSAKNEAALAGLVGHELSHLDRGHQTRRIKQTELFKRTTTIGFTRPPTTQQVFAVGRVMTRIWLQPFRPDLEKEADADGARWAYQAGYDCREFGNLFVQQAQQQGRSSMPVPAFFRSHPAGSERQKAILETYERLQMELPRGNLVVGEENLRRRAVAGT